MRVLHIITCLGDGGAEAVLYRLIKSDAADEHIVVSLMDGGKYGPLLSKIGVVVHALNMPRGRLTFKGLCNLWKIVRASGCHVIQTWMYHANFIGSLVGVISGRGVTVWGVHHTDLVSGRTSKTTLLIAKICAVLSPYLPARIIYCAEASRLVHEKFGYASGRSLTVQNGYDLSDFAPDRSVRCSLRSHLKIHAETKVLGFVARFDPLKCHVTLLDALAILRRRTQNFVCLLVGSGMDEKNAELMDMIAARGLSDVVHLLGRRDDIPSVMNALDLHVMSSMCEAFPNVLAEAMACGTPCISTDVGDAREIVGDTGCIVPVGDSEALSDALFKMLDNLESPDWSARQVAARAHIESNFSMDVMVAKYRAAWQAVADI